jgi:cell division protein FtsQ
LFFLGVALVVVGAWGITKSPLFDTRRIEVTGASQLPPERVLEVAKIGLGTNLFWFNAGSAEDRLESNPWVKEAHIGRSLPSTVRIAIEERRPAAQVKTGDRWTLFAGDGTVLTTIRHDAGLPSVAIPTSIEPSEASTMPPGSVELIGAMGRWLRSQVRSVAREDDGDVVVYLRSGVPAYYGPPTALVAKDQVLASLLRWARSGDKKLEWINVRAPVAPTAKLARPEAKPPGDKKASP